MSVSLDELLDQASLRYVHDGMMGFSRRMTGEQAVVYLDRGGEKITNPSVIERIHALAIPPAWEKVWISPFANGYLQATGYDKKKRKQYRYHADWHAIRGRRKFDHLLEFAEALPVIRRQVNKDLLRTGMPQEKVLATIVWLLENTLIRIGNEEYEKENKSYGLTTLKNRHVEVSGSSIAFQFKGKSGVYHAVDIKNKKVARIIKKCQDLPGQDLFEYYDDEQKLQNITSLHVNEYLKGITGKEITAKDFRTWGGTLLAARLCDKFGICDEEKLSQQNIVATVKKVATSLRNKPATCRKYYIHPVVLDSYSRGYILSNLISHKKYKAGEPIRGLDPLENNVTSLLRTFSEAAPELKQG